MLKKVFGFLLMLIGLLCFIIVEGGSMRYRNKRIDLHNTINEDLITIALYILVPIIGFILMKIGYKIVSKYDKEKKVVVLKYLSLSNEFPSSFIPLTKQHQHYDWQFYCRSY